MSGRESARLTVPPAPRDPRAGADPRVCGARPAGGGTRIAGLLPLLLAAATGGAARGDDAPGTTPGWHPAEVLALRDATVVAEVAGRVVRRLDDESGKVAAGEIVLALDAALHEAAARVARAQVRVAEARLEWARLDLSREEGLHGAGSAGEAALDRARVAKKEAEASLEAARAQADEAETRLARTRVVAPFDGRLVRILPEVGEFVQAGQPAFRLIDESELKIVAWVEAADLFRIDPGAAVEIEAAPPPAEARAAPALPRARVHSIAPAAEARSRTFRVESRLRDAGRFLRPGMTARIRFLAGSRAEPAGRDEGAGGAEGPSRGPEEPRDGKGAEGCGEEGEPRKGGSQ